MVRWLLPAAAVVLLGCAAGAPFERNDDLSTELTARDAAAAGDDAVGSEVLWAGRIVGVEHLEDTTRLEVVSYPLERSQRPRTGASPQGRFLVDYPGFLESADHRPGRLVTVRGPVEALRTGRVGEQELTYPVVATDAVHLWPQAAAARSQPQVRFGVGVMFSR
ncbi:Slp family lipoprotein [Halorhodospira halophila]|uniref:Slp family lipoprotein n=1 Tax=Halorhodospira halophila TaxID=1053 RepID=UPI0003147BFD|nr:Slp family lipoprotein [Halorhodospira halophila]